MVLAAAGLQRLGRRDVICEYFEPEIFIPAVGQGAIAIETLKGQSDITNLARSVNHDDSRAAVTAEPRIPCDGSRRLLRSHIRLRQQ